MKIKKILGISLLVCAAFGFAACSKPDDSVDTGNKTENTGSTENKDTTADSEPAGTENTGDQNQGETEKKYTITLIDESAAKDVSYTEADGVITISKATDVIEDGDTPDKIEIDLTGTFKGQIVNNVKGLVINLKGFNIENENAPAIQCNAKTEISAKKDTENSIKVTGTVPAKTGAINSKKNLTLGGGGKCSITGVLHGVKGDEITAKGSAEYTIEGGTDSSAINCNEFQIKAADSTDPKTVTLKLINAGNGIKADHKIDIKNGNLYFKNLNIALKTDLDTYTVKNETKTPKISLKSCTISGESVSYLYYTVVNNFTKDSTVTLTGIEETRAPDPVAEN